MRQLKGSYCHWGVPVSTMSWMLRFVLADTAGQAVQAFTDFVDDCPSFPPEYREKAPDIFRAALHMRYHQECAQAKHVFVCTTTRHFCRGRVTLNSSSQMPPLLVEYAADAGFDLEDRLVYTLYWNDTRDATVMVLPSDKRYFLGASTAPAFGYEAIPRDLGKYFANGRCCNLECDKTGGAMRVCSACKVASYCSRECQLLDWRNHKNACADCSKARESIMDGQKNLRTPKHNASTV